MNRELKSSLFVLAAGISVFIGVMLIAAAFEEPKPLVLIPSDQYKIDESGRIVRKLDPEQQARDRYIPTDPSAEFELWQIESNVLGFRCKHGGLPIVREDQTTTLTCEK